MAWLFFAFITAIFWGLVLACVKRSFSTFTPTTFVVVGSATALLILLPFALLGNARIVFWPLLPGALLVGALFIFEFYVLEKGKLALTGTVLNTYPFFAIVLAGVALGEQLTIFAKFGVGLILVGLMLISVERMKDLKNVRVGSWLLWGLVGALASGLGDVLIKILVSDFGPYSYSLAFVIGWLIIAALLIIFDRRHIQIKATKDFLYLCLGAVFLFSGYISLHLALAGGPVSLVTPITATSAAVSLFLALAWLKEKIFIQQLIGAFCIVAGVIMVSLV